MTPVKFEFFEPDGTPLSDVTFEIRMAKSGFLEPVDGIIMPETLEYTTDAQGTVTVLLKPSSSLYYLSVLNTEADVEDCCSTNGDIKYKFYVPESATEVRVQDLIMDPPPSTKAWDEAAILLIMDAKISSKASADAAKVSELASKASEDAAALSETNAGASELAAKASEDAALISQNAAADSQAASLVSQNAALASELAAAASADFASGAVQDMQDQVDEATLQASNAATSAGQAATSAVNADASADAAEADSVATAQDAVTTTNNKNATAADVVTITGLKTDVIALKDETEGYRDDVVTIVGSLGAIIVNAGPIDLSGGAYPAKPEYSSLWKVTVGGTVSGPQGDTYGIGDTLMYAKEQDVFYKIDNTENVSSVNGHTGAVSLVKADVGLANVDNTSDANKPLSTAAVNANSAQDTAVTNSLALKVAIADIVNTLSSTATDKPLSAAQGKTLYDLVQASNADHYTKAEDDAKFVQKTDIIAVDHGGTGGNTQSSARTGLGLKTAAVADILGTVSQTGGVPTGAIVEYSTGTNGDCVRFADGTQICTFKGTFGADLTTAVASFYTHAGDFTVAKPYAKAFVSVPAVTHTYIQNSWYGFSQITTIQTATNWPAIKGFSMASVSGITITYNMIAIGRWF